MEWNWQRSDWPIFTWDAPRLAEAEKQFLLGGGVLLGAAQHLGQDQQDDVRVEVMSSEALTTSEIEGEMLDRVSLQSSIRRRLGLSADSRRAEAREQGVAEMMVDVLQTFETALTEERLCSWQAMVTNGRRDLVDIGQYRTHAEPMQIVSARADKCLVYFEAPPSERVPLEMSRFLDWFNGTEKTLPALTRAGMAHLYFESIHPFEDGNGRVGRAVAQKALAQGVGQPIILALSSVLLARRREYYDALARTTGGTNDLSEWLTWFAGVGLEAQRRTLTLVEFLIEKTRELDRLRGHLNPRQEKALLRMFEAGPSGFQGGMTAKKYVAITSASVATATRDLADLTEKGALVAEGTFRDRRYHLRLPLRPAPHISIGEDGAVITETL
jgi:Fic family protein